MDSMIRTVVETCTKIRTTINCTYLKVLPHALYSMEKEKLQTRENIDTLSFFITSTDSWNLTGLCMITGEGQNETQLHKALHVQVSVKHSYCYLFRRSSPSNILCDMRCPFFIRESIRKQKLTLFHKVKSLQFGHVLIPLKLFSFILLIL